MANRIGVLMGGWGEEREISIKTGEGVALALESRGHRVTRILAGPGLDTSLREARIDVAFLALHGRMGEDGRVQGLLEVMGIPYTGSGVMASALAMHKPFAKKLFRLQNLPTPPGYEVRRGEEGRAAERHGDLGYPAFVKPARGGSSVGASVVRAEAELEAAVAQACRYGGEALVERRLQGRELTVGLLGDRVLGSCEIGFTGDCFTFDAKYRAGSRYFLPPRLSPQRVANVEALALAAFRALDGRGYGRVDLIASDEGNDWLLEVNTLPGMTSTSLLPKIAGRAGLSYEDLVERILGLAALDEAAVQDALPARMPPRVAPVVA